MMVAAKHDKCGSGPVITEWDGPRGGKIRAVCCHCWDRTRLKATELEAAEDWAAGRTKPWRDPLRKSKS